MASNYFDWMNADGDEATGLMGPNGSPPARNLSASSSSSAGGEGAGNGGIFASFYGTSSSSTGGAQGKSLPSFGGGGHSTQQQPSAGSSWFGSFGSAASKPPQQDDGGFMTSMTNLYEDWTIPQQSWMMFGVLFFFGMFFLFLSSFAFPWLAVAPTKFASLFSLGSVFILASFAALRGTQKFWSHCTETKEKQTITITYFSSLTATLYFSYLSPSYLFCLIAVIIQLIALLYFLFSYIPGGKSILDFVFGSCIGCCCPSWAGGKAAGGTGRAMGAR